LIRGMASPPPVGTSSPNAILDIGVSVGAGV
jgi:hypothetical protein